MNLEPMTIEELLNLLKPGMKAEETPAPEERKYYSLSALRAAGLAEPLPPELEAIRLRYL
jgi:hypothetical protein